MNINTIFEYLDWRGDLSFDKSPFNDIDAAILARFSYQPFDDIVKTAVRRTISLESACVQMLNIPQLAKKVLYPDVDVLLIQKLYASERFKHLRLSCFVNEIDLQKQTQFSAITYSFGDGTYYVAFRGTDSTIIGWKEDFNMGFEFPVPAQEMALKYFENVVTRLKDGTFILGGHSKGGNLAIYASAFCKKFMQNQIETIYNFDGPGFTEDIMQTEEFKSIEKKIKTFVPQFSIVGMILEHMEEYSVVKSVGTGIGQHELLTWELTKDSFVTLDKVDSGSRFFDDSFKLFLQSSNKDEREQIVEMLYQIVSVGDATTINDISENKFDSMLAAVKNFASIDDSSKRKVRDSLLRIVKDATKSHRSKN